ncbi:MAG TPA: GDP-mannose 4,6 dehydratase, partial [Oscillospiraceae bacterium]|nr:GDP-mannose 4,6 dehydratase [Oscillospiraceae bacterium]
INIASGRAVPIEQLLKILLSHTDASIEVDLDPQRLRPSDIPSASGDARILLEQTGWHPSFTLDETLLAVLNDWRQRVRGLA